MNNKILFKNHANNLIKIQTKLKLHQKPDGGQIILSPQNQKKVEYVVRLLGTAIRELNEIT